MSTHDSHRQAKALGLLAALAVTATACGSDSSTNPGIPQHHAEPPPIQIDVNVSQARVVAGDEIEVRIRIPGRGLQELAIAEAYVEWDQTRFEYTGGSVVGWDDFRHAPPNDGRMLVRMNGPAGLLSAELVLSFRAISDGRSDGFGLTDFVTSQDDFSNEFDGIVR